MVLRGHTRIRLKPLASAPLLDNQLDTARQTRYNYNTDKYFNIRGSSGFPAQPNASPLST